MLPDVKKEMHTQYDFNDINTSKTATRSSAVTAAVGYVSAALSRQTYMMGIMERFTTFMDVRIMILPMLRHARNYCYYSY